MERVIKVYEINGCWEARYEYKEGVFAVCSVPKYVYYERGEHVNKDIGYEIAIDMLKKEIPALQYAFWEFEHKYSNK